MPLLPSWRTPWLLGLSTERIGRLDHLWRGGLGGDDEGAAHEFPGHLEVTLHGCFGSIGVAIEDGLENGYVARMVQAVDIGRPFHLGPMAHQPFHVGPMNGWIN